MNIKIHFLLFVIQIQIHAIVVVLLLLHRHLGYCLEEGDYSDLILNFLNLMNEIIKNIHSGLTADKEEIELVYEPNTSEEEFREVLRSRHDYDIKNSATMSGPQRDDFGIFIDGRDVRVFGSQGQQRTAALSLKLAEIELVKRIINDDPVLLLDDVMSELDTKRRNAQNF